jgi:hypothetical protein
MRRTIRYETAVRLLGGDAAKVVQLVDTLVGAGMLALVGPVGSLLGWFDAKAELSRVTERMVTGLMEKRSSLSRFERTERLEAALGALAVAGFFEVLDEADLPRDLVITADEQRSLASRATAGLRLPVPGPAESHQEFRSHLRDYYDALAGSVAGFVTGLAAFESLDDTRRERFRQGVRALPELAVVRYESLVGRLAAEFPEVRFWAGVREQSAVHASLADLREMLASIAAGRAPDERREGLARAYAAALRRPIAESGEVPAGLRLPTLGDAFVPQSFRTSADAARLSSEDWWEQQILREDLLTFLTGHLTSRAATEAPLMVLGQPGSGKSVLAKILAAQLPANDFLPVLVKLRDVHAAADVQEQVEQAIRHDTGERLDWPALARSAGDALPLVILDGFDELLQATGVSQTDYLTRVAAFQRREADQGRPVAVVITSRTSVADRARAPQDTVAVRLEPFDESRVGRWVEVWNATNAEHFRGGAEQPLQLATAMRYPELVGQPLLLLMLAIYDAEGNSLRSAGELRSDQLYERLLERFARREVDKRGGGLPPRDRDRLVEAELRRLSVVAFAMFNRGAQWVTETQLDDDLRALPDLVRTPGPVTTDDLRPPLRAAELALGSFFFVHRARATRDDTALAAFEFLHATFGEFLVARLVHRVVREMVVRERASSFLSAPAPDDGLLHALLSFAPLAARRQIVLFVAEMVTDLSDEDRADWVDLLIRLFRAAQEPRLASAFDRYLPQPLTVPARIAAHTVNLLLLTLCAEAIMASRLLGTPDAAATIQVWRDVAVFWQSQRSAGWPGLLDIVQLNRIGQDKERDMRLALSADGPAVVETIGPGWEIGRRRSDSAVSYTGNPWRIARRDAHFTCDSVTDLLVHSVEPLHRASLDVMAQRACLPPDGEPFSALTGYLSIVHDRQLPPVERAALYRLIVDEPGVDLVQVMRCLEVEPDVDGDSVVFVVKAAADNVPQRTEEFARASVRCLTAHLDPSMPADALERLQYQLAIALEIDTWTEDHVEAAIRMAEMRLFSRGIAEATARDLLRKYGTRRPDFVARIGILVEV